MKDNLNGRELQWKLLSMRDNLNERQSQWEMTSMRDDINGRRAKLKTTPMEENLNGRKPQWKTTSMEDNLNGRWLQWKMTSLKGFLNFLLCLELVKTLVWWVVVGWWCWKAFGFNQGPIWIIKHNLNKLWVSSANSSWTIKVHFHNLHFKQYYCHLLTSRWSCHRDFGGKWA